MPRRRRSPRQLTRQPRTVIGLVLRAAFQRVGLGLVLGVPLAVGPDD